MIREELITLGFDISALVGLATLLALLPFPGYLSAWIQSFQKGMMSTVRPRAPFHGQGQDRNTLNYR